MRKDFLVVHLTPRCWHCDKYIMDPVRYRCERTRKERMPNRPIDMVDKRSCSAKIGSAQSPDEQMLSGEGSLEELLQRIYNRRESQVDYGQIAQQAVAS